MRPEEFSHMDEARLCHLVSGKGVDAAGAWAGVWVHRGTGEQYVRWKGWDRSRLVKLCLESRWLGQLHLQCYSLIHSETRTRKILLRNTEPWPWLASLNIHQQNVTGFSCDGVDWNTLEKWKPTALNQQVTLGNGDTGTSVALLQEKPFSPV